MLLLRNGLLQPTSPLSSRPRGGRSRGRVMLAAAATAVLNRTDEWSSAGRRLEPHALATYFPPGALPAPCTQDLRRGQRLRLFVYPLPWDYHGKIVQYVEGKARSLLGVKCDYLREDTCPNTGFSHLENLRSHCTDVPLMAKLLQSAQIVTDAEQAQVFLVPFLMGCNAMLGWGHGMQRVNAAAHHQFFGNFGAFARKSLPHYERYAHRHLFLFPLDSMFSPKWLRRSMIAHTGAGYIGQSKIDVPVPYLVSLPPQPAGARRPRLTSQLRRNRCSQNRFNFSKTPLYPRTVRPFRQRGRLSTDGMSPATPAIQAGSLARVASRSQARNGVLYTFYCLKKINSPRQARTT